MNKLILDLDTGVDDALAIAYALDSPEVELIGIAIFGGLISSQAFSGSSIIGATGPAASYSNLLLIAGCVPLIGVIYYLVIRKKIGE